MRKQVLPLHQQPHSVVRIKEIVKLQVKGVKRALFPTSLSIDLGKEDRQENMWVAVDGRV